METVQLGRPTPWRGIIGSLVAGIGLTLCGTLFALVSAHPENTPLLLMFLLIPAITIPLLIGLNQYAEFDPPTGLIRINGAAPVPLSRIDRALTRTFRGVSVLDLGTGPSRKERFTVANGPFGNSRLERDWARHLLPYTGLPRQTGDNRNPSHATSVYSATLEDTTAFAYERLR